MTEQEKQIEEMANEINEMDEPNAHYYDKRLKAHEAFVDCFTIAKHLYNKGYRKVEQGEWLCKQTMIRTPTAKNHICSVCGNEVARCTPYCAECGVEMVELPK